MQSFNPMNKSLFMDDVIQVPITMSLDVAENPDLKTVVDNTAGLMVLAPLLILYCAGQRFLVQGIESSGLAN